MSTSAIRLSKRLSWLLRHGANEVGLQMDEAGWADIDEVLVALEMHRADFDLAVYRNDKGRLVVLGDRVRACQGHSLEHMPVTVEGLEASWEKVVPETSLWHGTRGHSLDSIVRHGLGPGRRSHVHMAAELDSHVGKRHSVDVVIEISPSAVIDLGIQVFRATNGVMLARRVPTSAIVAVRPITETGRSAAARASRRSG